MYDDSDATPVSDDDKKDDKIGEGGAATTDPEDDPVSAEDLSKPAAGPGVKR